MRNVISLWTYVPLALVSYLLARGVYDRKKMWEVKFGIKRKKLRISTILLIVGVWIYCAAFFSSIRIDYMNNFSRYDGIIDLLIRYNPVLLLFLLQYIIFNKLPYVIKEKGICFEQFNLRWEKIKNYTWENNDKLKFNTYSTFLFYTFNQEATLVVFPDQKEEIQKFLNKYLENKEKYSYNKENT